MTEPYSQEQEQKKKKGTQGKEDGHYKGELFWQIKSNRDLE